MHTDALLRLGALPRARLVPLPSPLVRLERFSEALATEVWMKRDDIGSPALAGNKVRKLEFLMGTAMADGADWIVTAGAAQSNSARAAAAAAAACGLGATLVLQGDAPPDPTANLLLDHLLGADVRFVGDVSWEELDRIVGRVGADLAAEGHRPVTAPVGCSSPLGALGFVAAYVELVGQLGEIDIAPTRLLHTSTSGGTHAGLILGRHLLGRGPAVAGVLAGKLSRDPEGAAEGLARQAAKLLGIDAIDGDLVADLDDGYIGGGYAVPSDDAAAAIDLLARTEAILCDPVYSGKGLAALVAMAGRSQGPLVFWHTGGWHSLFEPTIGLDQLSRSRPH
jgi:1-aminocyclopropane-1-carboxylate deaminase/D-cysteine desulfhydrase-like pyridoxal-dependent ACC family enzyme